MVKKLIPRRVFFGNPDIASVKISPDGSTLSYLAPYNDVLNIWVAPVDDLKTARAVTHDTHRGIRSYTWTHCPNTILFSQDNNGDENWHIHKLNSVTGENIDLTPFDNIHARIEKLSSEHPDQVLIAINNRVPELHDVYCINLRDNALTLVYENHHYASFMFNEQLELRMACYLDAGGNAIYDDYNNSKFTKSFQVSHDSILTTQPLHYNRAGNLLYMIDSRDRNTAALTVTDQNTHETRVLYDNTLADVSGTLSDAVSKEIKAVSSTYDYKKWMMLDPEWQHDFNFLSEKLTGEIDIVSKTHDDQLWVVEHMQDNFPLEFYLLNRQSQALTYLFNNRHALENLNLCKMYPHIIETRDHLKMVSYLTLPHACQLNPDGFPDHPVPLVLLVHGGPNARDVWGLNSQHQWLANRGYAVLSVNYRGSTGFGQEFINAGHGEWSLKMHDDLIDAVNWATQNNITLKDKVAIMGGSYGGYAVLIGLTMTPDVFCCGINIVGVSNLKTLMTSFPSYWKPFVKLMKIKLGGDMDSPEGEAELERRSPLFKADRIKKPLLIGHGAQDPRVKIAESEQIVLKLKENNIPVTYAKYPDEGHGFARPENRLSFFALAEAFLHQHLGGLSQSVGTDFNNSSIDVVEGRDLI